MAVFLPFFAQLIPQPFLLLQHSAVGAAFCPLFLVEDPLGLFFNLHLHVLLVGPLVRAIGLHNFGLGRLEYFHELGQEFRLSLGFGFDLRQRNRMGSIGFDH